MKWAVLGLVVLATGCHDKEKDRGTCIATQPIARCIANAPRALCTASAGKLTVEEPAAGQKRCKAAGYDKVTPLASSCEGGYTGTFDMQRDGIVTDDMITSALNNVCAIELTKSR